MIVAAVIPPSNELGTCLCKIRVCSANTEFVVGDESCTLCTFNHKEWDEVSKEAKDILIGYAIGYNKFLLEANDEDLAPECQNSEWVTPIDEIDLFAYCLSLSLLASSENFLSFIVSAEPPNAKKRKFRLSC